jgi:hypothetical protein
MSSRMVSLSVRTIDGGDQVTSFTRRRQLAAAGQPTASGAAPSSTRRQLSAGAPGRTASASPTETMRRLSASQRLALHRTISEPAEPTEPQEGTPPPAGHARPHQHPQGSRELELVMRADAAEVAVQALQSRTGSMTKDLTALAEAFTKLSATVDDSSEGLNLLMDVMDTSVTDKQLAALEQRMRQSFEVELQAKLAPAEGAARAGAEELAALRESMTRQSLATTQRIDVLEAAAAQVEPRLHAAETLVAKLEAQTERSTEAVAACREAAGRSEERFQSLLEEELQSFGRSFGLAASSMDGIVQAMDRKLQRSMESLNQSVESASNNNVLQISQLAEYMSRSLDASKQRSEESEIALESIGASLGRKQQEIERLLMRAEASVTKTYDTAAGVGLLETQVAGLKDSCMDAVAHGKGEAEAAVTDVQAQLAQLEKTMTERLAASMELATEAARQANDASATATGAATAAAAIAKPAAAPTPPPAAAVPADR